MLGVRRLPIGSEVKAVRKLFVMLLICCVGTSYAQVAASPAEARKLDEFGSICCDDEKARLDNFVHALRNEPKARGYIIFYGGRRHSNCPSGHVRLPRRGEAEARAARLKPYVLESWNLPPERVVMINGGFRESWSAEVWIVPEGAKPPTPNPTVEPKEIRFRKGRKATRRDYYCEV